MDQKSSKIEELSKVLEYAKENKLVRVKMGDIEIELHPSAFMPTLDTSDIESMKIEALREDIRRQVKMEQDQMLYYSAN